MRRLGASESSTLSAMADNSVDAESHIELSGDDAAPVVISFRQLKVQSSSLRITISRRLDSIAVAGAFDNVQLDDRQWTKITAHVRAFFCV